MIQTNNNATNKNCSFLVSLSISKYWTDFEEKCVKEAIIEKLKGYMGIDDVDVYKINIDYSNE